MYAKRDPQIALNNQLVFMLSQRSDGRMAGMVVPYERQQNWDWLWSKLKNCPEAKGEFLSLGLVADYAHLQGYCFPDPAWKTYFWIGKNKDYLQTLYTALEAHDDYLWRTRDSNGDGLLETWCVWDNGEDGSSRLITREAPTMWPFDQPPLAPDMPNPQDPESFEFYWLDHVKHKLSPPKTEDIRVPFASMDTMAYSYNGRRVLAKISRELENGHEEEWLSKAESVRQRTIELLWIPEKNACFDRDREGKLLPELIHNNLRVMYHGLFTQEMADAFIRYHLLNPAEFWTPVPLPSVAANDPLFSTEGINNWSGKPMGLTYQRAIQALENYGHYAELSLIGKRLLEVIAQNGFKFAQELDPVTGQSSGPKPDGYGPMMLAALEYITHLHGVTLVLDQNEVWWSSLDPEGHDFTYTQNWGDRAFTLTCDAGRILANLNGDEIFNCTSGLRIVTDLDGNFKKAVGIHPKLQSVSMNTNRGSFLFSIAPNQVYGFDGVNPVLLNTVPFDYPFSQ